MAQHIKCDGSVVDLDLGGLDDHARLGALKKAVGGWLEAVGFGDGRVMLVNEEGKLMRLAKNTKATELVVGRGLGEIVGDVVLCEKGELR